MYQFGMHILENTKDISLIKGGAADVYSRDPSTRTRTHAPGLSGNLSNFT